MKHFLSVLFLLIVMFSHAQQSYWQQQADYKIEVTLNDTLHELKGFITITYKNNSPQKLDYIYMHLWPNAYRDQTSALADQLLENGRTAFYYSKPWQRGYMDSLNFKLDAEACKWKYDSSTTEICRIKLNHGLKTGESVTISTPFYVKLPETFSRLGHIGQSYQITQWYPKPAVYDKNGWHQMPYLDQGEFYSEYGSFDVSITLPKNYVVGATGDLQDETELKWLDEKVEETKKIKLYDDNMKFPASATELKTIHYKQNNIHDFGWFADKRYHVLKGEVELPYSKNQVTTWAMFTNSSADMWLKAPEYLHDAIYYYSLWVGEYPYKQVTAVDGTISAGSGMEYPNVTVIGEERDSFALDDVITHEVGHNWFYGLLGSNERDHGWMDEGINSYYEYRYLRTKYPNRRLLQRISKGAAKVFDIKQYKHKYQMDLAYQFMARENNDQPVETPSTQFLDINYGVIMYGKTMLDFDYLEAYLGTEAFDKAMKKYFEIWHYKHPQPEDLREVLENSSGKSLDWFFDDLINSAKKVDYKIKSAKPKEDNKNIRSVDLRNLGEINSPVLVSVLKRDSIIRSLWVEGFVDRKDIEVDVTGGDKIQIDPQLLIPEINRKNNTFKLNRIAHRFERLRLQFLGSIENQNRSQIFFAPYFGWNNYDKFQVGLALYSPFAPTRKFNYLLVPAIGTGSKQLIGFAKVNYTFFPQILAVQHFTIGIAGKRFSYYTTPQNLMFNKIEPYAEIELRKRNPRSPNTSTLHVRCVLAWLDWINYENNQKETLRYAVTEVKYKFERKTTLNPFSVSATYQQNDNFIRLSAEANFKISYRKRGQGFFIRVFAGGFPLNTKSSSDLTPPLPKLYLSNGTTSLTYWLQQDYMLDENYLDRNGTTKSVNRQVALTGGAFRSMSIYGSSSKFLASANFTSTILRFIPIRPFASTAVILNDSKKPEFAAEVGLSVVAIPDLIEIHLPLATTKNIRDSQQLLGITKWYQRFTFTLKWQMQRPINIIRQFAGF